MRAEIIALLGAACGALLDFARRAMRLLIDAGRALERAERTEAEAETARRRRDILNEPRTVDDVANRMSQRADF